MIKPLPMLLMIFYIHGKNSPREHLVPGLIEIGLIICLVGDVLLMSNEMSSFMLGTGFFMVGHIFYIVAFRMGDKVRYLPKKLRMWRKVGYVVIVVLLFLNLYSLWDKFPNKILFTVYVSVLAVEAIVALSRYEITSRSSFWFTIIGIGLFAISDNLLGFLKFNEIKTDVGRAVIMFTYYGAQYFIMHGALHQSNLQFECDKFQDNLKRAY